MAVALKLDNLHKLHPSLWRADSLAWADGVVLDSGFAALNQQLPGQGWPLGQLIELLLAQAGTAELSLLAPALRQIADGALLLINPPFLPDALAYAEWQIPAQRWLWVRRHDSATVFWACEQALKLGACGAVLCWLAGLRPAALRRLHLAAQASRTLFCLIRPAHEVRQASPAPLRLQLHTQAGGLRLEIIKRRGLPHAGPLHLSLPRHPYYLPAGWPTPLADKPATTATAAYVDRALLT